MNNSINYLLENLKRFVAAGDAGRSYVLSQIEVQLILDEIDRLAGTPLKIYSFTDIRDEARRLRAEHKPEDHHFPKDIA
jgi:hypothetical protein